MFGFPFTLENGLSGLSVCAFSYEPISEHNYDGLPL